MMKLTHYVETRPVIGSKIIHIGGSHDNLLCGKSTHQINFEGPEGGVPCHECLTTLRKLIAECVGKRYVLDSMIQSMSDLEQDMAFREEKKLEDV